MRALSIIAFLGFAASVVPAVPPSQLPYSQDALPLATFDARGTWVLNGVVGFSDTYHLGRYRRRELRGTTLEISDDKATIWNKKVMEWKPFAATRIGEETYDTQSREFWFDFRVDPQSLKLPRYVTSVDLELGQLVVAGNRILFEYYGVWYDVSRVNHQAS